MNLKCWWRKYKVEEELLKSSVRNTRRRAGRALKVVWKENQA